MFGRQARSTPGASIHKPQSIDGADGGFHRIAQGDSGGLSARHEMFRHPLARVARSPVAAYPARGQPVLAQLPALSRLRRSPQFQFGDMFRGHWCQLITPPLDWVAESVGTTEQVEAMGSIDTSRVQRSRSKSARAKKRKVGQTPFNFIRAAKEEIESSIGEFGGRRRAAAQCATKREADHRRVCAKGNVSEAVQHTRL